ncbi:cupin domain-containing protein [Paenibacillus sp. P25]|nr:cupin domain-containing protein [Paenibacillus sp. P25]
MSGRGGLFFVLSGCAELEVRGETVRLGPQEGCEVPPGVPHQMKNTSDAEVEFPVISSPRPGATGSRSAAYDPGECALPRGYAASLPLLIDSPPGLRFLPRTGIISRYFPNHTKNITPAFQCPFSCKADIGPCCFFIFPLLF